MPKTTPQAGMVGNLVSLLKAPTFIKQKAVLAQSKSVIESN